VLYESLTGRRPFGAGAAYEQLERRAVSDRAHRRVPAAFAAAIDACLAPDPAARPTVRDLTLGLRTLLP
jgi:hypothetical protein